MMRKSNHYYSNRCCREKLIKKCLHGDGNVVDCFVIDNEHIKGLEIHFITDHAVIIIQNFTSGKVCTKLIARPQQIRRYYENTGRRPPEKYNEILKLAKNHVRLGYNKV